MLLYGKKVKQWIFQKLFKSVISKLVNAVKLYKYMNLYEYQRSRLFTDLCPRSLIFNILKLLFLKKNTRPMEAIFHVEPSWDGRMQVSINALYHMTKMASMPIYAKKLSKPSSLEPKGRLP